MDTNNICCIFDIHSHYCFYSFKTAVYSFHRFCKKCRQIGSNTSFQNFFRHRSNCFHSTVHGIMPSYTMNMHIYKSGNKILSAAVKRFIRFYFSRDFENFSVFYLNITFDYLVFKYNINIF